MNTLNHLILDQLILSLKKPEKKKLIRLILLILKIISYWLKYKINWEQGIKAQFFPIYSKITLKKLY